MSDELQAEQHSPIRKFRYMFLIVSGRYSPFTPPPTQTKQVKTGENLRRGMLRIKSKVSEREGFPAGGSLWSHHVYTAQTWSSLLLSVCTGSNLTNIKPGSKDATITEASKPQDFCKVFWAQRTLTKRQEFLGLSLAYLSMQMFLGEAGLKI